MSETKANALIDTWQWAQNKKLPGIYSRHVNTDRPCFIKWNNHQNWLREEFVLLPCQSCLWHKKNDRLRSPLLQMVFDDLICDSSFSRTCQLEKLQTFFRRAKINRITMIKITQKLAFHKWACLSVAVTCHLQSLLIANKIFNSLSRILMLGLYHHPQSALLSYSKSLSH